jgi:3-isopropylmalate/(R)-2-methylmalate dehydratase large subunit
MGRTIFEKILGKAIGRRVHVGETVVVPVDQVLLQDGTAPRVFDRLKELGAVEADRAGATANLFIDHAAPPPTPEIASRQAALRRRAHKLGIGVSDVGEGISHQRMIESFACPGQVIVGADSHTCTAGALGAVALGMGSTDVACAIALGEIWLQVPATIRVELAGKLEAGVTTKDAMLNLVGRLGANGANYCSLEFGGEGLLDLAQDARFVLSNLAAEVGAKTGLIPTDDVTREYLEHHGRGDRFRLVTPDPDAKYSRRLKLDLASQPPMVAEPGHHDMTKSVEAHEGEAVDQVVIGSCTNGRVEDFLAAAEILRGRRVHARVRLILAPASHEVLKTTLENGAMGALIEAGGTLVPPGCGPCVGIHQGVLGEGQVCVATQARNYPGRMGDRSARIYLASPYTAAATALHGKITDPREVLDGA